MFKLTRLLVSERSRRLRAVAIWTVVFLVALVLIGTVSAIQVDRQIEASAAQSLEPYVALARNFQATLDRLRAEVTAPPCTAEFRSQLRRVAYQPDGLNEFLYAPGGRVHCSINIERFDPPLRLGKPHFVSPDGTAQVWIDYSLSFLGLSGLTGSIALTDPFAIVLPAQAIPIDNPSWMRSEILAITPNGGWWHRGGEQGIYPRVRSATAAPGILPFNGDLLHRLICLPGGIHCAAVEISLLGIFTQNPIAFATAILLAALVALSLSGLVNRFIDNYWAFEARFRRHLDPDTIRCAYQPILDMRTGRIGGCEVLARWTDIDGTLVMPDRFLAIVERHGLTGVFTRLVVGRAFSELSSHIPADRDLEVTFNIFPRDLDAGWLRQAFAPFAAAPDRFAVGVEIVENDMLDLDKARAEIEALRQAGICTYIDDFGSAYANIQTLAELPVEGVKLDRTFARAPDDSLLANLLRHAIEMIRATGRKIIVEGVETASRMAILEAAEVDRVQGYYVSPPLDIAAFAEFLRHHTATTLRGQRAA
jgi:sensor c-di-GMP phosphodiesterase-like protein